MYSTCHYVKTMSCTCLIIEDAVNDGYVCANGRKNQAQSTEILTSRIVRIAGELRLGDVDVSRVPTVDNERAENQPNSVESDVSGGAYQAVTERPSTVFTGVTLWRRPTARHVTGKGPVRPCYAHAQRATPSRRVDGRVEQVRAGDGHVTVVDFQVDADYREIVQSQLARRSRLLAAYRRSAGAIECRDRQRHEAERRLRLKARQSISCRDCVEMQDITLTRRASCLVQTLAGCLARCTTRDGISTSFRDEPIARLTWTYTDVTTTLINVRKFFTLNPANILVLQY